MEKICSKISKVLNKETILYLVFGVVTTLVNLIVFALCSKLLKLPWEISNIIAWIIAVIVAFITNKTFVFESKDTRIKTLLWEICTFAFARVFSLLLEYAVLYLMIDLLSVEELISKIVVNVLVIIVNYIFSKLIIFKNTAKKS